ncbi:MAG: hypothetical protein UW93_C0008G0023 [Parcubacteria group bacterium GW2011_GWC1_45_13]|uniref:Uncharacterized protein n=2 Tax=Candidatus Giovannoniibacteriota TaxID=1752738 RepID=A0A0G1LTS8_9BACT|nr:MAG: hypothetical protein UW49_C0016G0008 [Candidatus Giovannonibacteria bacterium GW2011_GWB1_44_23]KKT63124.1 MAG: hypothetical protein UW57_C0010G0013 [Candidatus Giovannonibacteria bacterium GW2011_GWA1_44_29]KKT91344.1 MAG: hypothetical protein UW93_C0008G0023 [Parcubacteria group bacterium GW2011_GWC1_45_13]
MIRCPYCGASDFVSLLGLQDHLEDGCPKYCGKCNKSRPTKMELSSFIMSGGADFDCPKICPHVIN